MKYVLISRLAPGAESVTKAFETFGKVGTAEGTQALYAATDGKTFITVVESDDPDMAALATYAPFMEEVTVYPVVDVDDKWTAAMMQAIGNIS